MRHFRWGRATTVAATIGAIGTGLVVWLLWPAAPPAIPGADRVRQYSSIRACMLTGSTGVADSVSAAAWAGMQGASSSSKTMVSYLPVPSPATKTSAVTYLTSLVQRQCGVIVAVGAVQVTAVNSEAARFRHVRFIVITARSASPAVVRIPPGPAAQVRTAVQAAVSTAVRG